MIDILLSTYNGEAFLRELLDSILAQTQKDWHLLIRDDGSKDSTIDIIEEYSAKYPEKISLISDKNPQNIGPCQSFHRLMQASTAPYMMFCDQDDVWLPEKTEIMLTSIKNTEKEAGESSPILVHCDLEVVNAELQTLSPSFIKHNKVNPEINDLIHLSIRNNVTACAMICNRSLIDLALPIPPEAIMHDWWLTLVAAALGEIKFIPQALVKYRQHQKNYYGSGIWRKTIAKYLKPHLYRDNLKQFANQLDAYQKAYSDNITKNQDKDFIAKFASLPNLSFWQKRKIILKYGWHCQPIQKTLIMLILV